MLKKKIGYPMWFAINRFWTHFHVYRWGLGNNKQVILDVRNVVFRNEISNMGGVKFLGYLCFLGAQIKVICVLKIKISYS